jgi:nicotinate-nucleotide--dimethylbenzimidazole phosphoribosyltransferase
MTADFTTAPAMTVAQLAAALAAGRDAVQRALAAGARLFIGGEMGIGNTTAAAALACALLGEAPQQLAGPGTGLDAAGVRRKAAVIARALSLHAAHCDDPLEALLRLGGFEIAALTGAAIACAQAGLPLLVDGFIVSAAMLAACRMQPAVRDWLLFGHRSAEPGPERVLRALDAAPLLALDLRLGEASGALAALPLLRLACALHGEMATFTEAGVAGSRS